VAPRGGRDFGEFPGELPAGVGGCRGARRENSGEAAGTPDASLSVDFGRKH